MGLKHYILSLLLSWTSLSFAQGVKFTASVNKSVVGTGEVFEVTFSVNSDAGQFSPPDFNGFQVVGGPNQSQSMESVNGNTSVSIAFSYELLPVKEGEFTINPASIVVNGRKLTTNAIRMKVVKGRPVPQQGGNSQQVGQSSPAAQSTTDLSKALFLRAVVDKENVYQGQQLTLTYRVYTRVGIVQNQVNKFPDLTGFWNEDVKADAKKPAPWKEEIYNGVKYDVADIKQVILFSEHAGNITIDPYEMTFIARIAAPSHDLMEQFFGGRSQDVKFAAKSLPVVVHVKPLPAAGKPDGFTGAVGKFSINATIDKTHLKANEALNYKIKVEGSGNIKLLKNLNTNFPADFEKYDPKVTDTITESISGVAGTRFYNYLLIPRHQGDYTLDPVKFSYFNPNTGKYVSLATPSFKVKVDKGLNENNVTAFSGDKQDVKLLDKDIHYIKLGDAGLRKEGDLFFGSVGFYVLLLLGPVLCIGAYVYRNLNEKRNSDVVKVRSRRASKLAAKHLANAKKQLAANNSAEFYEAIFHGLYGYLSDKLNISAADLNKETIAEALKARSVTDSRIDQLMETLDLCEMARFAPVKHISEKEVFEKAKDNISDLEDEI